MLLLHLTMSHDTVSLTGVMTMFHETLSLTGIDFVEVQYFRKDLLCQNLN